MATPAPINVDVRLPRGVTGWLARRVITQHRHIRALENARCGDADRILELEDQAHALRTQLREAHKRNHPSSGGGAS